MIMECQTQTHPTTNGMDLSLKVPNPGNGSKNGRCAFKILNKIGQGGYGFVFTVEKTCGPDENTVYAMKVRRRARLHKGSLKKTGPSHSGKSRSYVCNQQQSSV
jgi:hypothetical protein